MSGNIMHSLNGKKICVSMYMVLSGVIFGMSLISALINHRTIEEASLFFLFQLTGILLPGAAIFRLLPIKELTEVEKGLVKYVLGYCFNILIYFVIMLSGIKQYTSLVITIVALISSLVIVKKKEENEKYKLQKNPGLWGLLVLLFLIFLVVFARRWCLPVTDKDIHGDLMFWIGDSISLQKGFVPKNFRYLSEGYKYHYFGAMQISVMCMFTKMSAYAMAVFYSYIESVVILGLAVYCFVRRFIKDKKIVFFTIFLILFTTGLEHKSVVTYIWHIYLLPMSYTIAYSLEMIAVMLLLLQNKKEKLDVNILIVASICLTVCTGMKGPAGAVVLVGIAIMCAYWLFWEKRYIKAILYGMVSLGCFCGIYFGLLAEQGNIYNLSKHSQETVMEEQQIIDNNLEQSGEGQDNLLEIKIFISEVLDKCEYILREMIACAKYCIACNPWTFAPAVIYLFYGILCKKCTIEEVVIGGMIFIGIVLGYVMDYYGSSQMYFALSVFQFAGVLTGKLWEEVTESLERTSIPAKRLQSGICVVIGILCIVSFNRSLEWEYAKESTKFFKEGLSNEQYPAELLGYHQNILMNEEYEAYEWIRKNSEEDVFVLSDRMLENGNFCYFPGVFTERYTYYYGGDEVEIGKKCYNGDRECQQYFLDRGVDYITVTKRISPDFSTDTEKMAKVFENEKVAVYKVL